MYRCHIVVVLAVVVGASAQWGGDYDGGSDCSHCLYGDCDDFGTCTYGCIDGWFNSDCQRPCYDNCLGLRCEQWTGYCADGCNGTMKGVFCDEMCFDIGCRNWDGQCEPYDYYNDYCDPSMICCQACQGYGCVTTDGATVPVPAVITTFTLLLLTAAATLM